MAPKSPPTIRFDQLNRRYSVDVSDVPGTATLVAVLARSNVAADADVMLLVNRDGLAESPFEIFLGTPKQDRCQLRHGQTVPLFIALKPGGQGPTTGTTQVQFRLQGGARGGRLTDVSATLEARLVTQQLTPPEIKVTFESEVSFGVVPGSTAAPAEVIIATLAPHVLQTVAMYDGPPPDLMLQREIALVAEGAPAEVLPVRVGTRPLGRTSSDDISWSRGGLDPALDGTPMRGSVPFPLDGAPTEIVLGIAVRDAIEVARRVSDASEFSAEIEVALSLTLMVGGQPLAPRRERRRIRAHFSMAKLITVSSRDIDPVAVALSRDPTVAGVKARDAISRRVNVRSKSSGRTSSLEASYGLALESFAGARDPRLNAEFALTYEGREFRFPQLAVIDHELRHGKPISLPLRDIVEQSILKTTDALVHVPRRADLSVAFRVLEFEGSRDPLYALLVISIEIEMIPPDLIACIDLGTSATSVWFGMLEGANPGGVLPLGELIHDLTGDEHEEYERDGGVQNVLLPSPVGLSPDRNLRARSDPLSLGQVELSAGGKEGAERRVKALGRRYDISVPFVPRQDIPAYCETIVFHPKRSLIATHRRVSSADAFEVANDQLSRVGQIDIPGLIVDVFDELGGYLVPRAITYLDRATKQPWSGRRPLRLADVWLEGDQPTGAIVTHPSGVSAQGRQAYVDAGRRFLARLTGQSPGPAGVPDGSLLWVKLVPEAIAAINYGIGHLRQRGRLAKGKHVLAALDIGAGTYDATLVEAEIGDGGLENWAVLSHFGVTVGGLDLDRAVAERVANLLRHAIQEPQVASLLSLDLDLDLAAGGDGPRTATQRYAREIAWQDEIQRAKKQLTASLFRLLPDSTAYTWSHESGVLLEVVVGREPAKETLPVRRRQASRVVGEQTIQVDSIGPTKFVIRPSVRDGSVEIVLQIGPGHFTARETDPVDAMSPDTVTRFLGTVLPRMVLREVSRRKMSPPTWIVTGRTALWPPLYAAVATVAASVPGGRMASLRPFPPPEMKDAVIRGALALASNPHLPLGNDILNPLAVVSIAAEAQVTDPRPQTGGRRRVTRIAGIHYLSGSDQSSGRDEALCTGRCELVRAVPGLSDATTGGRPDEEALEMFDAFGVPPYDRLLSDIAQISSHEAQRILKISWSGGDRVTSLTIDPGDDRGPQRYEVPNRESRIYHD